MRSELEILEVEKRIRSRVKKQMEKTQKEYYLNEQMRAIQKELGEKDEFKNEIQELEEKLRQKKMPAEAREKCEREIKKLKMMSPMSAEATVVRNYLDWFLALPWFEYTEDKLDIKEAERILEEDHYGLEKVKQRILEYLAVQTLVGQMKGPILCLVGPPGVGKTSLGKSIARATGRKFVRVSLGGVRDEAEIRGHRRTYIGALPGKIIQSMRKAGSGNPGVAARRGRQDVDRLPRRSVVGAARSARSRAELHLQRSLSRLRLRSVQGDVRHHRQHARAHPASAAGPDGNHPHPGLHRDREAQYRQAATWCKSSARPTASRRRTSSSPTRRSCGIIRLLHARGRRAQPRARNRLDLPQGRGRGGQDRSQRARHAFRPPAWPSSSARRASATGWPRPSRRSAWRRAWRGPRWAASCCGVEVDDRAGPRQADRDRPARRGDAGERAGGALVHPLARRRARARRRTSTRRSTSTFTFPRARRPRTAPRPASRWRPRWSRRYAACRCATTWR